MVIKIIKLIGYTVTLLGSFFWVFGVGITDRDMGLLTEHIKRTGCNSHRNVARLLTFKNFSSKCLEQTLERSVEA